MTLEMPVRSRWTECRAYLNPPQARCGHIAVTVNSRAVWGDEFVIVHGGINRDKHALGDLVVLQCDQVGGGWGVPGTVLAPRKR